MMRVVKSSRAIDGRAVWSVDSVAPYAAGGGGAARRRALRRDGGRRAATSAARARRRRRRGHRPARRARRCPRRARARRRSRRTRSPTSRPRRGKRGVLPEVAKMSSTSSLGIMGTSPVGGSVQCGSGTGPLGSPLEGDGATGAVDVPRAGWERAAEPGWDEARGPRTRSGHPWGAGSGQPAWRRAEAHGEGRGGSSLARPLLASTAPCHCSTPRMRTPSLLVSLEGSSSKSSGTRTG